MTYLPMMAQYVEPGMESPLGVIKDTDDDGAYVRVDFQDNFHVTYGVESTVLIAIDLEAV